MTDTPQGPTPFADRLTPEIRALVLADWDDYMRASKRAADAYRNGDTDQQTWACDVCGKRTELPTRRHKKCEAAA